LFNTLIHTANTSVASTTEKITDITDMTKMNQLRMSGTADFNTRPTEISKLASQE